MIRKLRIAHCSDIHLDGDAHDHSSAGGGDSQIRGAFSRALKEMRAHNPDMMLLAGDLFDSNSAATDTITWAMSILEEQPFPIVMIPGNHDCMTEDAIYRRHDFNQISNVTNLTAELGEVAYIDSLSTAVWGRGMIDHSPDYNPLEGCPERPENCKWYFGMGHGIHVPHGGDTSRSSPIHMSQLEESPCDYLALGHHHAALELINDKATAAYSGSPTDDVGLGATYIIIDVASGAPTTVAVNAVTPQT
jgi:DNA repair exonuclease SbcCD nuclease subunit